jgi:DNA-binding transcriptional LysR family regulator
MDSLQPMRIFVSVVQNGSLSSAGRQLGLSPASVSRHISALEEGLGCRLINRTSRKLTLTEAGELYFKKVEQVLLQIAEANDSVAELQATPRGTLRVHSRMLVGHLLIVPALPTFLVQNPEVKVDLLLSNRVVDLVEQNVDIDIRIGKLVDSSLVGSVSPSANASCARHPAISTTDLRFASLPTSPRTTASRIASISDARCGASCAATARWRRFRYPATCNRTTATRCFRQRSPGSAWR